MIIIFGLDLGHIKFNFVIKEIKFKCNEIFNELVSLMRMEFEVNS